MTLILFTGGVLNVADIPSSEGKYEQGAGTSSLTARFLDTAELLTLTC